MTQLYSIPTVLTAFHSLWLGTKLFPTNPSLLIHPLSLTGYSASTRTSLQGHFQQPALCLLVRPVALTCTRFTCTLFLQKCLDKYSKFPTFLPFHFHSFLIAFSCLSFNHSLVHSLIPLIHSLPHSPRHFKPSTSSSPTALPEFRFHKFPSKTASITLILLQNITVKLVFL